MEKDDQQRLYDEIREVSGGRGFVLLQDVHASVAHSNCFKQHLVFGKEKAGQPNLGQKDEKKVQYHCHDAQ